jgi:hypothetical protein
VACSRVNFAFYLTQQDMFVFRANCADSLFVHCTELAFLQTPPFLIHHVFKHWAKDVTPFREAICPDSTLCERNVPLCISQLTVYIYSGLYLCDSAAVHYACIEYVMWILWACIPLQACLVFMRVSYADKTLISSFRFSSIRHTTGATRNCFCK